MIPRALVLGSGYAGQRHAEALRELGIAYEGPRSAREAVNDPTPITDPSITVVHVCATNELHPPLVLAALDAGRHVVCEKPLALDVATAAALATRAAASPTVAVLGYNYRFYPMVVELVWRIRAGELGEIHDVRGSFLQDWLLHATDDDWRVDPARGGASRAVADIGAHLVDLIELTTLRSVRRVVAHVGRLHGRATEDHAGILLEMTGGLAATCALSQASAGRRNELEITIDGSRASATWRSSRPDELWIGQRDDVQVVTPRSDLHSAAARRLAELAVGPNQARRNLLAAIYARVGGDDELTAVPLPTFADGVRHQRLAAAALESARRGAWVDVA